MKILSLLCGDAQILVQVVLVLHQGYVPEECRAN
jgi:hypothetical protein